MPHSCEVRFYIDQDGRICNCKQHPEWSPEDELTVMLREIEHYWKALLHRHEYSSYCVGDVPAKIARVRELAEEERAKFDKMSWAHVEALDCLMDLYSVQNGCPLPGKYDEAWTAAMRRAEKLLGIEAKEE